MNSLSNLSAEPKPFSAPKFFSAKRFVDIKKPSQDEWLKCGFRALVSSDCAAVCGLNPYMSLMILSISIQ